MIEYFKVNNYKCMVDVKFPLTQIHVIIGQNDSGKTSLLEAMLALSRSTEEQLIRAFPGHWPDRELVFAGEEKPEIQFEVRLGEDQGASDSPITYHLEVEFGKERSCRRIEEWSDNSDRIPINTRDQRWTGVAHRFELLDPQLRAPLSTIAGRLGSASLYRFDPQLMAIPAAIDPNRKFRMDPNGFGLATLLDDILGYDPERFLALRRDFCEFFRNSGASGSSLFQPSTVNSARVDCIQPISGPERESSLKRGMAAQFVPSRLRMGHFCSWDYSP